MKTIQYTVKGVPERIDRLVRQQVRKTNKSLNTVLLEAISDGIGALDSRTLYHDLDDLVGTWQYDPEFDRTMDMFEKVDEELWK